MRTGGHNGGQDAAADAGPAAASCCRVFKCNGTATALSSQQWWQLTAVTVTVAGGTDKVRPQQWRSKAPSAVNGNGGSAMDDCGLRRQTATAAASVRHREEDRGWRIRRRIMHAEVRGEVVLSPLASVGPYGRNTTKANIALFPLEGAPPHKTVGRVIYTYNPG